MTMDQLGTSVAPEVQDSLAAASLQFEMKTEASFGRKRAYSESASSLVDRIPGKIRKLQFKKKPSICNCVKIPAKVTPDAEDIEQPKAEMNTPSSEEREEDKEKEKKEILSMMECPVCLEHPREGPIYNCEHGHLVCGKCQPKIRECPICRSANVGHRNLFAEKMLSLTLKSITLPCTNHNEGCKVTGLAKELHKHESICMFRKIQCPAHHRGACHWQGSLTKLYPHLGEKKCAQIIKVEDEDKSYVSVIGDFVENETVFNRTSTTHWKPVMLVSRKSFRFFAYLVMSRTPAGEWYFYVRSFTGDKIVRLLKTKITVRAPSKSGSSAASSSSSSPSTTTNSTNLSTAEFSYFGSVNIYNDSEETVIKNGKYLFMKDAQVKQFNHDKTILEYEVQLSFNSKSKKSVD